MLLSNPIDEDVFERTNLNEDEEKKYERLINRNRKNSTTNFDNTTSSSFWIGRDEDDDEDEDDEIVKKKKFKYNDHHLMIFLNSRIALTISKGIRRNEETKKMWLKRGQVKCSRISERDDFLCSDDEHTKTCDVFVNEQSRTIMVECKIDVPMENANEFAKTLIDSIIIDDHTFSEQLSRCTIITSFVSSFADGEDLDDENDERARFCCRYIGDCVTEDEDDHDNRQQKKKSSSTVLRPLQVGRALVGCEAALFNQLCFRRSKNNNEKEKTKIAIYSVPDERSFSAAADDSIDYRALENIVDILRLCDEDYEQQLFAKITPALIRNQWARNKNTHNLHNTNYNNNFIDENLFS